MIDCEKCSLPNKDDSLYCEHCGERLSTKACRRCKTYVPPKVKYCTKCGYPAEGAVCEKCGKVNPDDSAFCSVCGNKLGGAVATAQSEYYAQPQTTEAAKEKKPAAGGKAMYAYRIARSFTVSALLMCMFVFSFFGMFKFNVDGLSVSVNGFDAVRGMFLLISPSTYAQNVIDFAAFFSNGNYGIGLAKAVSDFGALRMTICEETLFAPVVAEVLMWGLQTLAIMVLTLTFFIITLVHAINVTRKKTDKFFKHEVLALALVAALTFGFLITGNSIAGGAIAIIILGCLGLGGITACKYAIEKLPRTSVISNVRRGVCAMLAIIMVCFAGSSVMKVGYSLRDETGTLSIGSGAEVKVGYFEIIDGMAGSSDAFAWDISSSGSIVWKKGYSAADLDKEIKEAIVYYIADGEFSEKFLEKLEINGNPMKICFSAEAERSYGPGATAMGWLSFAFLLLMAGAFVMFVFKLFMEEAEPEKTHKTTLWSMLSMVGAIAMMVTPIVTMAMASSICKSLKLGFTYSIGALPIVAAVLGIGLFVVDLVLHKCDKKKA